MHIFILESLAMLTYFCDVLVKHLCRQEVGPCGALEGGADLYHPVHHLCAVLLRHLVAHYRNCHSTL